MKLHYLIATVGAAMAFTGIAVADDVIYDSGGFETFTSGSSLHGQDGWSTAGTTHLSTEPVVTSLGPTQVVRLTVGDEQNMVSAAHRSFGDILAMGYNRVTVSYDVFRVADAWQSNLWWWWDDTGTPTYGLQWDSGSPSTSQTMPFGFSSSGVPVTFNTWENITMTWDFTTMMATSVIAGNPGPSIAISGITSLSGWQFWLAHDEASGTGDEVAYLDNFRVTAVPEPSTVAAVAIGLAGLIVRRRR